MTECPVCGSPNVLPIAYGEPSLEMVAAHARGELALGGCIVGRPGGDPDWRCTACSHEFRTKEPDT
jgi:hypothetical protein